MKSAIKTIREEHRSISAVLHALKQLAKDAENPDVEPRFDAFRAMIYYIDQFPERLHHPKEDRYLFAHLVALEVGWQGGAGSFRAAVDAYAEFHWQHMRKEEDELLPLAERCLMPEDW